MFGWFLDPVETLYQLRTGHKEAALERACINELERVLEQFQRRSR